MSRDGVKADKGGQTCGGLTCEFAGAGGDPSFECPSDTLSDIALTPDCSPARALVPVVVFETREPSCNGGQGAEGEEDERDEENE